MPPSMADREQEYVTAPQPVGFSPHSLQSLNTPDTMGRVMILHQPRVLPIREGTFQARQKDENLVVGGGSRVRYSAMVMAIMASDAETVFQRSLEVAMSKKKRYPEALKELDNLKDNSKLTRWKMRVIRELMTEAQEEAARCESELDEVHHEIKEEEEDQKLDDDARRALLAEARDTKVEFSQWKRVFSSRSQENKDVKAGLEQVKDCIVELEKEVGSLKDSLEQARRVLPAAMYVLKGQSEATDLALELNASVDPFTGAAARWAAIDTLQDRISISLTPAEKVRRALKEENWEALSLDEKRFTMVDRVLNPDLYHWMKGDTQFLDGIMSTSSTTKESSSPCPKKDSLVALIGAGPLSGASMDGIQDLDEALRKRQKRGWSNKARDMATSSVWEKGQGEVSVRSEASGGVSSSRVGLATTKGHTLTLAEEWILPDFQLNSMEVTRIMGTAYHRLDRIGVIVRKLLRTYHDDPTRKGIIAAGDDLCDDWIFDLGASVRAKLPEARSVEERDWVTVDQLLYPEFWKVKKKNEERGTFDEPRGLPLYHMAFKIAGDDGHSDMSPDQLKVLRLLLKYNGAISTYLRQEKLWEDKKALDETPLTTTTSKRIAAASIVSANIVRQGSKEKKDRMACRGIEGPDVRVLKLLRELAAAKTTRAKYMDSDAMHSVPQRFPTERYAVELEAAITSLLREQVFERERALEHKLKARHDCSTCTRDSSNHLSVSESSDGEAENWEIATRTGKVSMMMGRRCLSRKTSDSIPPRASSWDARSCCMKSNHEYSESKRLRKSGNKGSNLPQQRRNAEDEGGGREGVQGDEESQTWHGLATVEEFTAEEVEQLVEENHPWEGCRACFTLPCRWAACADHVAIGERKEQLKQEILRLMGERNKEFVETVVPLSCVRGGDTLLLRTEAIREMRWENKELDRHLHLAGVDRELHDAYASTADAMEVKSLHHYPTLMWCDDAKEALEEERDHLLARTLAVEIVDDMLEVMLEGWAFGVRQAEHSVAGFVPAVKPHGFMRPGDQRRAVRYLEHRHRLRQIAHQRGERLPEERRGTHLEKGLPIDDCSQERILAKRAKKKEEEQGHLLTETENTLKFGLFTMVLGYLHSMNLVQREREAWSGARDVIDPSVSLLRAPKTRERKKMIEETVKERERVAARARFLGMAKLAEDRGERRLAHQKQEVSRRRAQKLREKKKMEEAAREIQRIFRGYRGRVLAQRWALKRAEIEALKSVMHEAAVNVQRTYRGYLGRVEASEVRMELAEYITGIRVKEAEADLVEYWDTHKFERTKTKWKKTLAKPLMAMRARKLE
ncbi:unnamed protein product [Discosporangium mesarthrocarpum]